MIPWAFILATMLTLLQGPGGLQPGTGIIAGTLRLTDGSPARSVRVSVIAIDDADGVNLVSLAETDAAGRYQLSNIPEGRYHVVAGRLNEPTYYPRGNERAQAAEVQVTAARLTSGIDFTVPGNSQRPTSVLEEEGAYRQILNERNAERRLTLLLSFERNYPRSQHRSAVLTELVDIYARRNDPNRTLEYGNKSLQVDPNNVTALIQMSRTYALNLGDYRRSVEFGEKAVAAAAALKTQPPPAGRFSASSWASWVARAETDARSNLEWARQMAAWSREVVRSSMGLPR